MVPRRTQGQRECPNCQARGGEWKACKGCVPQGGRAEGCIKDEQNVAGGLRGRRQSRERALWEEVDQHFGQSSRGEGCSREGVGGWMGMPMGALGFILEETPPHTIL